MNASSCRHKHPGHVHVVEQANLKQTNSSCVAVVFDIHNVYMYIQYVKDDDGWFLACEEPNKETGNLQYVN